MISLCPKCLDDTNFIDEGVSSDGRTFKIYDCQTCGSINRVFDSPQTESEVVLVALVTDAHSDSVPAREQFVEDQLRLWSDEPRVWY